jgi:phage shock protein A
MLKSVIKEKDNLNDAFKTQSEQLKVLKSELETKISEINSRDNQIDYFQKVFEKVKSEMVNVKR